MRRNKGVATLFVTSLLLVAALIIALGSYRGLFYQIKRAQNEVIARQNHWAAEGGLECVYTQAMRFNRVPSDVSLCKNLLGLTDLSIAVGSPNIIAATSGYLHLNKAFSAPNVSSTGAIRSTSDLVINGSYTSSPDPGKSLGNNLWECTAVRYFNYFYATSYNTHHPYQPVKPYQSFPSSENTNFQMCHAANYSFGITDLADTAEDYTQDTAMDPFKDVFDVAREDWFDVMSDNTLFGYVPYSLNSQTLSSVTDLGAPGFNAQCAEQIVQNIEQGRDVIWVYGGCEINDSDFDSISSAINTHLNDGIILVVHNGILSVTGSQDFNGMLYHFLSDEFKDSDDKVLDLTGWDQTENDTGTNGAASVLDGVINALSGTVTMPKTKIGYFQNGAFNPSGGYVMDGPGTFAVFNASLAFTYNRDVIDAPLRKFKQVKWYRGSWNDL